MTLHEVESRLRQVYPGAQIEVRDLTGSEDHYQVLISSEAFTGMSRIRAHQAIMDVFAAELRTGEVHALTIRTTATVER